MKKLLMISLVSICTINEAVSQTSSTNKAQAEQNAATLENLKPVDKEGWTKGGTLNLNIKINYKKMSNEIIYFFNFSMFFHPESPITRTISPLILCFFIACIEASKTPPA